MGTTMSRVQRNLAEFLDRVDTLTEAVSDHAALAVIRPSSRRLEKVLAQVWTRQGRAFVNGLSRFRGRFPIEEAVGEADWSPVLEVVLKETNEPLVTALDVELRETVESGAARTVAEVSVESTFDVRQSRAAQEWLEGRAGRKVTRVGEGTRRRLRVLMRQSADEGWSWTRTARAIEDKFRSFHRAPAGVRSRAELVAVTEMTEAYEAGHQFVREDIARSGVTVEKSWETVGDDRVDPDCVSNEGAGWVAHDDVWPSGAGGPPDHPGCRCVTTTRTRVGEET